jgi:hypothetical protein
MTSERIRLAAARLTLGMIALLVPLRAIATPAHEALVVGNATYTAMPGLPGCLLSAHAVAASLQNLGFNVVEREDASSGAIDAAISEFSQRLAASPGAAAVIYICTHAVSFNDRPFLLPVTASIARPADLLTQGLLAKSVLDVLVRDGAGAALLALDLTSAPGNTVIAGLGAILEATLPDTLSAVVASQTQPHDGPTPLATSLVANLKGSEVQAGTLLAAVQQQLVSNQTTTIAALRQPTAPAYLTGAPAPPPPTPPAALVPVATPAPAPTPAQASLPGDDQLTEAERRRVQAALVRLGYYAGQVDGLFGPDTRAAIRRYQHELGAAMTGRLTAEQANKLVSGN